MAAPRDPHRFVNELGPDRVERLIERLESRGRDRVFTRLFETIAVAASVAPANTLAVTSLLPESATVQA